MRIEGSEVITLITGVVVLFSALAASSNKKIQLTVGSAVQQKNPADRWQRSSFLTVIFISKFSALSEFIVYLPTASDFGVML